MELIHLISMGYKGKNIYLCFINFLLTISIALVRKNLIIRRLMIRCLVFDFFYNQPIRI